MGQLERYGLYVLVVVIVLILGVAIWGGEPPVARGDLAAMQTRGSEPDPRQRIRIDPQDPYEPIPDPAPRSDPTSRDQRIPAAPTPLLDDPSVLGLRTDPAPSVDEPGPVETPPAGPREIEHVLADGEFLSDVSKRYFGTIGRWQDIARWNGIDDPTRVPEGTTLLIRLGEGAEAGNGGPRTRAEEPVPAPVESVRTYVVQDGDSLSVIAQRTLGSQRYVPELKRANGLRSDLIRGGQKLVIPQLGSGARE